MEKQRIETDISQTLNHYETAIRHFQKENYEKAVALFEKVAASPAKEVSSRARVYLRVCEQRLHPPAEELNTPADYYEYGLIQLNQRNLPSALENLSRADKLEPNQDHIQYALAAAHSLSEDVEAALESLEVAIALNPVNAIHARRDEDFCSLESNSRFRQLVAKSG